MTDQPGQPGAAPPGKIPDQYMAQAADAVGQVQADPATDATQTIEQIQQAAVRAALGEFEQKLAAQLAAAQQAFDSQREQLENQLAAMTRQLHTVRQQAGPPDAQRLADSVSGRLKAIAVANPDLGAVHFAGVISQGEQLAEQVKAIADGNSADTAGAERIAHGIGAWFTRAHPRISSKFLEGSHIAMDELERIVEALPELVPAASAIAAAV